METGKDKYLTKTVGGPFATSEANQSRVRPLQLQGQFGSRPPPPPAHSPPARTLAPSPTASHSGLLPPPATASKTCMSAAWKRWRYIRRLAHFDQMDFEFAFWQMVYLMSAPDKVFRDFGYRKRTKLQFARDDPAFLVLLSGWLLITSAGFALVMGIGFLQYVKFLLLVVFVDCLGVGAVVATLMWFLCNRYLVRGHGRVPELDPVDVEWGFCFDVHLNAFFPVLIVLHFVQLFFYSVLISQPWVVATLVGNLLWLVALVYYVYITFLGYNSLGILHSTKVFLYPLAPICAFILLTLALNWNLTKSLVNFYHFRLL